MAGLGGALAGLSAMYGGYKQGEMDEFKIDDAKRGELAKVAMGNALKMLGAGPQGQGGGGLPQMGGQPPGMPPGQPSQPMQQPSPVGGQGPPGPGGMPPRPGMGMPPGGPSQGPGGMPQMGGPPQMPPPGAGGPGGMSGGPPPGMGGPSPQGMQQPGGRQLDWRQLVQAVQQSNPNIKPDVLAEAVNQFLPMMNAQSQQEWRQVSLQIREQALQQREQQFMLADQTRRSEGEKNREFKGTEGEKTREFKGAEGAANRVSRETIAKMTVDERREAHEAGIISKQEIADAMIAGRERVAGAQIEGRKDVAGAQIASREGIAARGEEGKKERLEMSLEAKTAANKLSIEAKREIAQAAEAGKGQRAELSAETRKEIQALGARDRKALTEYVQSNINERFARGEGRKEQDFQQRETSRAEQAAAGIKSREGTAARAEEGRGARAAAGREQKAEQFSAREKRLQEGLDLRSDTTWERLEQQKQAAIDRAASNQWKQGAADVKTLIDAQDKHVRTKISASNILSASQRKVMLEEADKVNAEQLASLRTRFKGREAGGAAAPAESSIPPEAIKALKEGQVTTFENGQKWTLKAGKPEQVQ